MLKSPFQCIFVFCRKNPIHFQQFSHPNDDEYYDMVMVAKDDNDNRPECPYGTACYRWETLCKVGFLVYR